MLLYRIQVVAGTRTIPNSAELTLSSDLPHAHQDSPSIQLAHIHLSRMPPTSQLQAPMQEEAAQKLPEEASYCPSAAMFHN
jgi:hypothetical protein